MAGPQDLIWILDNDPSCITLYKQTLGLLYDLQIFSSLDEILNSYYKQSADEPRLLIADPENAKGSLSDFFRKARGNGEPGTLRLPEFLIVSRLDDLELIRFYLKTGVRDYILKPIRPNELVAKVERALNSIANREILILRNDLDGNQIPDLTLKEYQLLTILISRPDRPVKRDELYSAIWANSTVNKKTLDVHLFNLRRKIRPFGYDILCEGQIFSLCKQEKSTLKGTN